VAVSRPKAGDRRTPSTSVHSSEADGRWATGSYTRERTTDLHEAEGIVAKHYLPNRIYLPRSPSLDMDFAGLRIGSVTAGRLSYGQHVRLVTEAADNFHVNMPIRGQAVSRCGKSTAVHTGGGEALVFSPGAPADIQWEAGCAQLCLMIPRARLEAELERLLGRSVREQVRFEFEVAPVLGSRRIQAVLGLVALELDEPSGLGTNDVAGRHLEGLVLDGLLLEHRHNYSGAALGGSSREPGGLIKRAVDLIEDRPGAAWTTVGLATELHLSVRALQAGFKREVGVAPMAYLRLVRLRRAHRILKDAHPAETTVSGVAVSLGLLHQGRFAADYRTMFGEMPSETLRR
jgi:AraC-like DNA-binding protein